MRGKTSPLLTAFGAAILSLGGVWMVADELASGQAYRRWGEDILRDVDPTAYWLHLGAHGLATLLVVAGTAFYVRSLFVARGNGRKGER